MQKKLQNRSGVSAPVRKGCMRGPVRAALYVQLLFKYPDKLTNDMHSCEGVDVCKSWA